MAIIKQSSPATQDILSTPSTGAEGETPLPGVGYLIGRMDRALKQLIGEALSPLGVTVQQYTALSVIRARGRLSNAQLAKRSMISPQATSEVMKILTTQRWITRQTDATNARIALISLTDAGIELLKCCDQEVARIETVLLSTLDVPNKLVLRDTLKGCLQSLNGLLNDV